MGSDIKMLVSMANEGDKKALEELILQIQDKIYGLALRMLYNPTDAEDASQEILLKIVTHLGTFRGESSFSTWMYRVAANHLLTMRKRRAERGAISFEEYEKSCDLKSAMNWQESQSEALQHLFVEEIRISCLQGVLLCLDREHRLAYLLADVFDVSSEQGADILEITPAAFRKRLSRARERMQDFLTKNCALINPENPCHCEHLAASQLDTGRFDEKNIIFAKHPCRIKDNENTLNHIREMDELRQIAALYKRYPDFRAPAVFIENLRGLVGSKKYELL
ncbi:MAG: RNA polymerase sigma factor [Desulfobacterales bacterium]|nr:RNA polymerase sigma factor [Desulfobacterales bacterium]